MAVGCIVDDAAGVLKGDALCVVGWDGGTNKPKVARATRGTLLTSKTVFGIAEDNADDTDPIQVLAAGDAARDAITSLGPGDSRVIATDINQAVAADQCRLVRVERPDGSEYVVGTCDEAGNLAVQPRASRETSDRMVLNVRSFGAVGDDDADDTAAFQDALTALGASGGGVLFVPLGTYRITDTLAVPLNTSLTGEEPGDYLTSQGSLLRFRTLGDGISRCPTSGSVGASVESPRASAPARQRMYGRGPSPRSTPAQPAAAPSSSARR